MAYLLYTTMQEVRGKVRSRMPNDKILFLKFNQLEDSNPNSAVEN